jgi:glycosyltransferase involved in cell wall biosynthesis
MKIGVIFFHKNIRSLYKERWIDKCIETILNQTYKDFSIYEINYGEDDFSLFEGMKLKNSHTFISEEKSNHAEAMNQIIDLAFEDGCDYVFNTNLDDYYSLERFEKQIRFLKEGYDIVSSDFCYIEENGDLDIVTHYLDIKKAGDIKTNILNNNNVIAHPCVSYSRNFWENNRYNSEEIPEEDFLLWKRSIQNEFKFHICDEILLNYRLHKNQITGGESYGSIKAEGDMRREERIRRSVYGNSSQVNSTVPTSLR